MPKMRLMLLAPLLAAGCSGKQASEPAPWKLDEQARQVVSEEDAARIFKALDAARQAGTSPSISHFQVRAATVVVQDGKEHVIVGGNTEYQVPEAIHGESSLLNHVANLLGSDATHQVRFIAYYTDSTCGSSISCGDCRDYQIATTDYMKLLVACGQASDHSVHLKRFADAVAPEEGFPEMDGEAIPLPPSDLERLTKAAQEARRRGINLFTDSERHAGAAGLSWNGNLYRAAGADDAAFHYRYAIGGLLQQAATEGDYLIKAIVVAGEEGSWPKISYRERQYGYEASSFNRRGGKEPIHLILTNGRGRYRLTTFEEALPHAFSTDNFMPEAVDKFLESHKKATGPQDPK